MVLTHKDKGQLRGERRYWLWVTRPEHYLDQDGAEYPGLDPSSGIAAADWWTCHKDTQRGDLVLLWRTAPRCDIGYLMQAESDAYSIADDNYAIKQGWDYACEYRPLYKFANCITVQDLHRKPHLQDWSAYRGNFQHRVFEIPAEHWYRLTELASEKNPGYRRFVASIERSTVALPILLEEQLEEQLAGNLRLLKRYGFNLSLYTSPIDGTKGRQLVCRGNGGRIDLLCCDNEKPGYVVIELKNVQASPSTFGQVASYMGWVQERIAGKKPVIGLVISRGRDARFDAALRVTDRVFHLDLEELGFK